MSGLNQHPSYRGRFAPSPTGPLHLGSLYTAVASYLQARKNKGTWLVRIDDLDPYRTQAKYADHILSTLENYGLCWDESVLYQSQRHAAYREALNQLGELGLLYGCACTRRDLTGRLGTANGSRYDGHCRELNLPLPRHAVRCRVSDDPVTCEDLIQGAYVQQLQQEVGDFIVYRRDQVYAYHIAVVVDDDFQQITEVFRGYDLLESTPRQIYLQQQLNMATPAYAHIPVLVDHEGCKLSKQTFADDVANMPHSRTLFQILQWLQLDPPSELQRAEVDSLLQWGIAHWDMHAIQPVPSMAKDLLKALQLFAPAQDR